MTKVLGRGQKWSGGDYMSAPGGGQKVRLLKEALQETKSEDQVLLFTDRYGVWFIQPKVHRRTLKQLWEVGFSLTANGGCEMLLNPFLEL